MTLPVDHLKLVAHLLEREKGEQLGAQDLPRRDNPGGLLSFAQERIWFLEQLAAGSAAYHASPACASGAPSTSTRSRQA